VEIDRRVPAFLGRILDDEGDPIGTCFQVQPGVLVTALHVLNDVSRDEEGASVRLDPLQGGAVREGRVERVDHSHDLAVVVTNKPLAESVAGLAPTDKVPQATPVAVTGVAIITDPGHSYRHLDTNGHWAGGTTRDDQIQLGRIVVEALMKGMSGAPVLSGNFAVGIVSARYNSADEWARNSVWVARTEDLTPLLSGLDDIVAPQSGNAGPTEDGIMIGHARAAPSVESQGIPDIVGDGVFVVGLDIKPGVYLAQPYRGPRVVIRSTGRFVLWSVSIQVSPDFVHQLCDFMPSVWRSCFLVAGGLCGHPKPGANTAIRYRGVICRLQAPGAR
jgi:hypothetical protein